MKIAITSNNNSLESSIDQRFGRCTYLAVYDTDTKSVEFILNPNKDVLEGAGPATVQLLAENGVRQIVSSEFGGKVKILLDNLQIKTTIIKDETKKISDIIKMLDTNTLDTDNLV